LNIEESQNTIVEDSIGHTKPS